MQFDASHSKGSGGAIWVRFAPARWAFLALLGSDRSGVERQGSKAPRAEKGARDVADRGSDFRCAYRASI